MANKEVNTLIKKVKERGFTIVKGGSHFKVLDDNGQVITTIPGSPSDWRWLENTYRDFRRQGYNLKEEILPTEVRERLVLVRDDLASPTVDNHGEETNRIRFSLKKIGLRHTDHRSLRELADVIEHLAELHPGEAPELVRRLWAGETLHHEHRRPLEMLLEHLDVEDPIRHFYRLLRRSHNLPEEPHPVVVEEVIEPLPQPERKRKRMDVTAIIPSGDTMGLGVSSIEEMVGIFIETLEDRNRALIEESNKTQDLIDQLRKQYPGIQVIADGDGGDDEEEGDRRKPTHRVTEIKPASSGSGNGGTVSMGKDQLKQNIVETLQEGGEWTQRELYEKFNVHQTAVSTAVRELITEGTVVVVTPGSGGRGNATTYGFSEIYGN